MQDLVQKHVFFQKEQSTFCLSEFRLCSLRFLKESKSLKEPKSKVPEPGSFTIKNGIFFNTNVTLAIALLICCKVTFLLQFGPNIFPIRLDMAEYKAKIFPVREAIKTAKREHFLASDKARGHIWGQNWGWSSEFSLKKSYWPQRGYSGLQRASAPPVCSWFRPNLRGLKIAQDLAIEDGF